MCELFNICLFIVKNIKDFNFECIISVSDFDKDFHGIPIVSLEEAIKRVKAIIIAATPSSTSIVFNRIYNKVPSFIDIYDMRGKKLIPQTFQNIEYWDENSEKLKRLINNYDVISFDIFDTLIMRKTLSVDDLWIIVQEKLSKKNINIPFVKMRRNAENIANQKISAPSIEYIYKILKEQNNFNIKYAKLNSNYELTFESIKEAITEKTKVISIAHITNVIGDSRPIEKIIDYAHKLGILVVIDGAQSVPHMEIDVQTLDIDFLAFSAHKMCGPTGVGILYGKESLLNNMKPLLFGGGMNASFDNNGVRIYKDLPYTLEAGTPNIADVISFGGVVDYIQSIGMKKIHEYEKELKKYAISRLKEVKDIIIYNEESENGIISFNIKDVFSQDLAIYLNKYKICVRAGNHCAKILKDELGVKNTCRASFYFYNTKEEIDKLVLALKNPSLKTEII